MSRTGKDMDRWLGDGGMPIIDAGRRRLHRLRRRRRGPGLGRRDLHADRPGLQPPRDHPGRDPLPPARCVHELRHQRRPARAGPHPGHARDEDRVHAPRPEGRAPTCCGARSCAWPSRSPTARRRCVTPTACWSAGPRGPFSCIDPTPTARPARRLTPTACPPPGPGSASSAAGRPGRPARLLRLPRRWPAGSASPLAPVFPVRLCPLPGPALHRPDGVQGVAGAPRPAGASRPWSRALFAQLLRCPRRLPRGGRRWRGRTSSLPVPSTARPGGVAARRASEGLARRRRATCGARGPLVAATCSVALGAPVGAHAARRRRPSPSLRRVRARRRRPARAPARRHLRERRPGPERRGRAAPGRRRARS